jgi:hypothetical protein
VHCFVALNRALCAIKGTESQTSVDPTLNRAVILLDDVIEIRNNAAAASSAKHALLFKLFDNGRVGRISIYIDYAWARCPGAASAFWKKRRALVRSRVSDSKKSIVAPVESTALYNRSSAQRRVHRSHPFAKNRSSASALGEFAHSIPAHNAAPISKS